MATFRFEIMYKGLGRVAHFSATMQSLKLGYHYLWIVPVDDTQGTSLATIFVHLDVQTYFSDPDIEGDGTLSMTRQLQEMMHINRLSVGSSETPSPDQPHGNTRREDFKKYASEASGLSV